MSLKAVDTFVDTNVLVYLFDTDEALKHRRVQHVLDLLGRFVVSTQVLGEFYVTVIRKLGRPLGVAVATEAVEQIQRETVVIIDSTMVRAAIETSHASQISYWDALIVEAAVRGRCSYILSEDLNAGQVIRGVEIVDPFADH